MSWKTLVTGFLLTLAVFCLPLVAQTPVPDLQELKLQLQQATDSLKKQQKIIEALQKRVADLEAKQATKGMENAEILASKGGAPLEAQAEVKPAQSPFKATWKDGQSVFSFPSAEIRLTNRLQVRWTQDDYGDPEQANMGEFRIRRFKTQVTGWAYTPDLTFRLQVDWANANTSLGVLDDACVDYDFTRGKGYFRVQAGQFKIPFGRQTISSTKTFMFSDRSFVTTTFSDIRDVGIMVWGQFGPKCVPDLVEYRAGIFNGGGRSVYTNTDARYQTDYRIMISPWGSAGYDEATPFGSDKFKLSFGLEYEHNDRREDSSGWMAGKEYHTAGYDLMLKYKRLTAYGEYFDRRATDSKDKRFDSNGLNSQIGFLLIPKRWEVFVGYWSYDPDKDMLNNSQKEMGLGTNWYFSGFNSKLQAEWRKIKDDTKNWNSYEFRLQYQFCF